ncbi:MAG: DUF3429 domain-containing protein [Azoarcus sp.]|mgnify:CR=1 FL=1|nr:MAG: DUF3429 domain-containing protein [Azoarcus sp.]
MILLPDSRPQAVAWLGYGGLLPFVMLTALLAVDVDGGAFFREALIGYGAVILSFVGALHWGFAMALPTLTAPQRTEAFVWSTVPALLAWPATWLVGSVAVPVLVCGFIAHYVQDLRLARRAELPVWYLPLRLQLSVVACACLSVSLLLGQVER